MSISTCGKFHLCFKKSKNTNTLNNGGHLLCSSDIVFLMFNFHFCSGTFNLFLYVVVCSHKLEGRHL